MKRWAVVGVAFFSAWTLACGATYYVDKNNAQSSDTNSGTASLPWKTIQKAANTMVAGDTATVVAGNYSERVTTARNGASGTPITFRASGNVVMKGFELKHDFIIVDGFEVTATGAASTYQIMIWGSYCQVLNNNLHDSDIGSYGEIGTIWYSATPHDCIIRGNHVWGSIAYGNDYPAIQLSSVGYNNLAEGNEIGPIKDCDAFRAFGHDQTIRSNYVHDISLSTGSTAHTDIIQTFGVNGEIAYNIVFENNLIKDCDAQMFMTEQDNQADIRDWDVRNNVYINVALQGNIIIPNFRFYNNVLYNVDYVNGLTLFLQHIVDVGDASGTKIKNNIFIGPGGMTDPNAYVYYVNAPAGALTNFETDYNYVTGDPAQGYPSRSRFSEVHGINGGDPKFVNMAGWDFHLQSNSPAIDKGTTLSGFNTDRDGITRPQGLAWDMGAFEYHVSSPQPPVITSATAATGNVGVAFTYQITASGSPTSYGAAGLPPGLGINTTNGAITGTPTTNGITSATISAMNSSGTNMATLTIMINASAPGPSGLIGWWKLDESSGTTAADSSGNGNNGTLSGGTWQTSGGKIAGALHLNAFDVVNCGAAASLNTPSVTVAFWMKPDSLGNVIPVDKLPATGTVGYAVKLRDTGTIWFRVGAEGGPALDVYGGSNIYTNGVWTHVACTFDAGTSAMRMYINGVVESHQPTFAVTLNASNTTFRMGSTVEQYAGLLDDVRVYDHALTSNEIVTVMAGGGSVAEVIRFVPAGMSAGSTGYSFSWCGTTGATNNFQVYRRTNLVAANWQLIAPSIARSGTGTNLWTDTNVFQQAFYRVATPNQ
jgi:hypothetical protein